MSAKKVVIAGLEDFDLRLVHPDNQPRGWVVILNGTYLRLHQHAMTMQKYAIAEAQSMIEGRGLSEVRAVLSIWMNGASRPTD